MHELIKKQCVMCDASVFGMALYVEAGKTILCGACIFGCHDLLTASMGLPPYEFPEPEGEEYE